MGIKLCDTKCMKEEEWLKLREHGPHWDDKKHPDYIPYTIGGSAVSSVFNLSPFTTALELFHQKRGVKPAIEVNFNSMAKKAGHKYEPYVADTFVQDMREKGHTVELIEDTGFYQHETEKWAVANLDYKVLVDGELCILECKTTSYNNTTALKEWKSGVCPIYYLLQVMFYMFVMNIDTAYICCCWGFYQSEGNSYAVIKIERSKGLETHMITGLKSFILALENGTEPTIDSMNAELLSNYYYRLFGTPKSNFNPVRLNECLRADIEMLWDIQKQYKAKEKELTELEHSIKVHSLTLACAMQGVENATLVNTNGTYLAIKQSIPMSRTKFLDVEKLKNERPDLYGKYLEDIYTGDYEKDREQLIEDLINGKIDLATFTSELEDLKDLCRTTVFNEQKFRDENTKGATLARVVEPFFYKKPVVNDNSYNKFKIEEKEFKK